MLHDCRLRAAGKTQADNAKKTRTRDRGMRGVPAPEANAELQANIDVSQPDMERHLHCFQLHSLVY